MTLPRLTFGFLVVLLTVGLPAVGAVADDLPAARDFSADGQEAARQRLPVLVFFSAEGCHYCEEMASLFLRPMYKSGEYNGKVIFREVRVESGQALVDFDGKKISHEAFAHAHRIGLTPQVRFFDAQGREVAPPLVGLTTPDFFAGYLDEAINSALARVRTVAVLP
jgi:thioredoxin-related protein